MSLAAVAPEAAAVPASAIDDLDLAFDRAAAALRREQRGDGHFAFDLEDDATIPAGYVMSRRFLGEADPAVEGKIGTYLRRTREGHGGHPLVPGDVLNASASVKAHVALLTIGDPAEAPHMLRARRAVFRAGGAAHSNVFTRAALALFGMAPWRAVPATPIEVMNAPSWFPSHIFRISCWARDTLVPLLVLMALKPKAANPRGIDVRELLVTPPDRMGIWPKGTDQVGGRGIIFGALGEVLKPAEPRFPRGAHQGAVGKAVAFVRARLDREDGLGAISPAMADTVIMIRALGVPDAVLPRAPVDKLLAVRGDWAERRPGVRPGGWAFQCRNDHDADLDGTAVVVIAMDRARSRSGDPGFNASIARAREWVVGLQSRNGGWAPSDADNTATYLDRIPFAGHGALLDPPTADVTARVVSMLEQLGEAPETSPAMRRGIDFPLAEQHAEGGRHGRWGFNCVYGIWSVLCALNAAGVGAESGAVRRAVAWLFSIQDSDGGWGEDDEGYDLADKGYSTASQTAWAVIGLMPAREVDAPAVERGFAYLRRTQAADGFWPEDPFAGTGFPRVFWLHCHGCPKFFPLRAMARYRNPKRGDARTATAGM